MQGDYDPFALIRAKRAHVLFSSSHVAGLGLTCGRRVTRWLSVRVGWLVWCPSYGQVCSRGANQPTGGPELD